VGKALIQRLLSTPGQSVVAAVRAAPDRLPAGIERACIADLSPDADWRTGLAAVDTVFHLAARVHVMHDTAGDPLAEFRRVNVDGTLNLARQAAAAGVRRFVFVSSVKVNGEQTTPGRPFTADDAPAPADPYGVSKHEAELGLRRVAADTGMEVVIVRPPLVYGPGVKANFLRMMRWVQRGIPLPFGAIDNRRSLVARDNLVDLLVHCSYHPAAAGEVFLAGDGEDLSTTQLLQRIGDALDRPARLIPVPRSWLALCFGALGKKDLAQRLCGSLQVDIDKTRSVLGWTPPLSVPDALRRTAAAFQASEP
jgi:UDP-glucose 4-epimerase